MVAVICYFCLIIADYIDVVDEDTRQSQTPPSRCGSQPHPVVTPEGRVPTPEGSITDTSPEKVTDKPAEGREGSPTTPREDSQDNRARKGRTIYKAQQVYVLEQVFSRTHYPDPEVIETLSRDLDISENKIKVSIIKLWITLLIFLKVIQKQQNSLIKWEV